MVVLRSGKSTTPYTKEQEEKVAAILREKKEKMENGELIKQAKMLAMMEEQKAKQKQMEEFQKWKKEHEEKLAAIESETEEEVEVPLERRGRTEERGESSGARETEAQMEADAKMERLVNEWVAKLALGEEDEALLFAPQAEWEQFARELEGEENPMKRQAMEEDKKLEWKLHLARKRKRRLEAAEKVEEDSRAAEVEHGKLAAQIDLQRKVEILSQSVEVPRIVGPKEEEARPRRKRVKVKFPDHYSGKAGEDFDNWEANVNSYVHLQNIAPEDQVLVAFHGLKDEATNFARSLALAAKCENDMVTYSILTPLSEFLSALRERFTDVTRGLRASDKLQTVHTRQWKSARAMKTAMDELVAVPGHGVIEPQLVQLFYRTMPEKLHGHFFDRKQQPNMTYDTLSREVVAFEARSMPVTTFWHKDLAKGKKWKGHTITSQVKAKDSLILTLDEGGLEEVPYSELERGLDEEDSGTGQGRTYAAVAVGGSRKGKEGAKAKGARPLVVEGKAARGLARGETAKQEDGVKVLEKLREDNFKINAKKCEWAKTQVLYLGHALDGDGIKPEDSKIAAIRDWLTPHTLTELRSFLGLENYFRKFVRNFSTVATPLRRLLKKEAIWKWDKDCTSALKKLKRALIEYIILKVADLSLPFVVTTDANQYDIGTVLQQDDGNGYRPVEFMSARMPSEKVATSTYERELYTLRQALDHWKHYLLGRHFKVYSDHETLRWLKTQAKMTPKLTRWAA
ncbi:hypothetical protein CBR_g34287 [Chara braunii]|uniref:Reverse transcriptase RNase H-like domain-containing protein n=1 Tax=Chara braunii TaxID=69332 RepID=A0A388JYR7_CHABU|nr:hypothetical protein CBR_g34287 [Chara braunii]|eukprot:GBG62915.1 hypothetical protein CBR_g34287 [Chara braunii]